MSNTALNRTTQAILTNKSGGNLNYGDVVVLDNTNDNGFTTTTTAGLSTRGLGVILEPNGIANNASGMVATGGWCPKINLNTSATDGQFIKTHTVAGQGTPHASPQVEGDFAVALTASATPTAILFGSPNGPSSGGSGTVTHTAGALTLGQLAYGNASADIKVVAATDGQIPIGKSSDGTAALATLTQSGGTTITNAANSITIASPSITQGTYASLPATCAVGDVYYFTDSVYNVAHCATLNTWSIFLSGKLATPPAPVSGWTGVNTGANWTQADASGAINIQIARNASLNWRLLTKTNTAPYTVTAAFRTLQPGVSSCNSGLYFYDGTKLMGIETLTQTSGVSVLRVQKMTSVTVASTTAATTNALFLTGLIYFRIADVSSTLTFSYSVDGVSWYSLFSEAVGTFITPTSYGFGGVCQSASGDFVSMSMQSIVLS